MRSTLRLLPLLALTAALAFKIGATRKTATAQAAPPELNACGCYRDSAGTCYCGKKTAKCVCPGECEPKGCDEKRAKELNKEIEAEAKRARDADRKQQEEQAERKRKEEAPLPDDQGSDDADAPPPVAEKPAASSSDDDDDGEKVDKKKARKKGKAGKSEKALKKASEPSAGASG